MSRITALLLIALLFFVSCDNSKKTVDKSHWYIEEEVDFLDINSFLSEAKIISLESKNYLVGYPEKIIKDDSLYYILDNRHNKCIYLFNTKGEEAGVFKKFGEGNYEYLDINDFDLDNEQIVLLCYPNKLLFIDKRDLKIKKVISLPKKRSYNRLTIDGERILLYDHYNSVVENVNLLTGQTEIVHNIRPLRGYVMGFQPVFHKCSDKLFFHAPGNDTIYAIKNNQFDPFFTFDYEEKKLAIDFFSNIEPADIKTIEYGLNPVINIVTIFEQDNSFGFIYTFRGSYYINTIKNGIREDYGLKANPPLSLSCFTSDNKLLSWENSYNLEENKDVSECLKGIKLDNSLYHKNGAEANPILFEYIIK